MIRFLLVSFLLPISALAAAEFKVNPDQYYRALQMLEARGAISGLSSNKCEIDTDDKTYFCKVSHDGGVIIYRSIKPETNLTSITFGAAPKDIPTTSALAAMAIISLDSPKSDQKAARALMATAKKVRVTMESVYIRHGSDMDIIGNTMDLYMNNSAGDMAIIRVVPEPK